MFLAVLLLFTLNSEANARRPERMAFEHNLAQLKLEFLNSLNHCRTNLSDEAWDKKFSSASNLVSKRTALAAARYANALVDQYNFNRRSDSYHFAHIVAKAVSRSNQTMSALPDYFLMFTLSSEQELSALQNLGLKPNGSFYGVRAEVQRVAPSPRARRRY